MKGKKIIALLLALVMILSFAACGSETTATEAVAEPAQDYDLKLSVTFTEGHWLDTMFKSYIQEISDATDGHVNITLHYSGELGTAVDQWELLENGGLEMLMVQTAQVVGQFPIAAVIDTAFMANNATMTNEILKALDANGYLDEEFAAIEPLMWLPTDMQTLGALTNKKVEKIEDFKGLNLRAPGAMYTIIEAVGATSVSVATTELYQSLETGVLDGCITSPVVMQAMQLNECCKYMLHCPVTAGVSLFGMEKSTWDSLPADYKLAIKDISDKYSALYMDENDQQEQAAIDALAAAGMEVYEPSDELLADMKAACAGLQQAYVDNLNSLGYDGAAIMSCAQAAADRVAANLN